MPLFNCSSCDWEEDVKDGGCWRCGSSPAAAWRADIDERCFEPCNDVVNASDVGEKITEARAIDLAREDIIVAGVGC